jgi:putative transcriptional regulator
VKKNFQAQFFRLAGAVLFCLCAGVIPSDHSGSAQEPFLAGQFLVATPEMGDPRFAEAVIYMVSHDQKGAMGLVINRPVAEGPLSDLLKALGTEDEKANGKITIHYGGPVDPERLFVLHSADYVDKASLKLANGLAVTGDSEILHAIAGGKGPKQSLFIFGYAGWAPGQLEAELGRNDWFSIPAEKALIFDGDAESKWERAMKKRKIKA